MVSCGPSSVFDLCVVAVCLPPAVAAVRSSNLRATLRQYIANLRAKCLPVSVLCITQASGYVTGTHVHQPLCITRAYMPPWLVRTSVPHPQVPCALRRCCMHVAPMHTSAHLPPPPGFPLTVACRQMHGNSGRSALTPQHDAQAATAQTRDSSTAPRVPRCPPVTPHASCYPAVAR